MLWFYILISVIGISILAIQLYWLWMVRKAQKVYLKEMQAQAPTMFDVREMLLHGDKDMAVKLYCEIFSIEDIERARKDIEELQRSIKS
ncbi:MAG: hypothetical protein HQL21_09170 [Candidatus Omnitrophica bacterium]|nr:hypothetical protein [Candidatus Omnitrophota bacterium]